MSYPVKRALTVGLLVTIGALFASTGIRARVLDAYVIALAGVLMLMLIRTARTFLPDRPTSQFDAAYAAMRAPAPAIGELSLERDVELGRVNEFHFYTRIRPVLREIASSRLRRRYGVDLDREPLRARELLGTATWDIVRLDVRPPGDRLAPGPPIAFVQRVVDELERL